MKNTVKIFAFALVAIVMTACSKYEEGSKFTLLSKKSRMANTWTLKTFTVNDVQQVLGGTSTLEMDKDGKATSTWTNSFGSSSDIGSWEFSGDKEELVVTDSDGDVERFEIVMLKSKDLKLRQVENGFTSIATYEGE